ncbi:uncharacterized protein LOC123698513 [Colias croceus]|uniref:uncharacterized protein LOC123698513 n=1 Tax=Colias crocea TaxID=72248 RepID=UPI001E27B4C5|nr:uncharacterized protein LOC123698513 [Colias croceus]
MSSNKPAKKTVKYARESLQQALKEIRDGQISIREAARKYTIPRCTIQDRLSGRRTDEIKKQGPEPVLGKQGEEKVVKWLINIAKCGFPVKKQELLDTVQKILKDLKMPNPFKDDRPGQTWYLNFLKRHPEISVRSAEGINKARARVTEESIRLWFRELEIFLQQEGHSDILEDPNRMFNGDESGFSLCPKSGKVLGPKGYRNLYQIKAGNEKDNLTVLVTFNASGEICPPLIVFPYIRPPKSVTDSMPKDWTLGRSESGWMNGDVFFEYIVNDFNKWITEKNIKKPVLLLVDGHKSHMSLALSSVCEELGIILYALPPNTTHMLQPADVSVFAPLKAQWKSHVRKFLAKPENLNNAVTKTNFCLLFKDIIENPQMKTNIINGFRRCGLHPYDPNAVDYTKCVQNTLEQFSRPADLRENSGITNEDLIATRKVIRHLRPVLKQKKIDTKFILTAIKKLRSREPREPQYITGSEDNTNSTLDASSVPGLLSNDSAHTSATANASNVPPPHFLNSNSPHVSDVTSANFAGHASFHTHDPALLTLLIPAEDPDRTSDSVLDHGLLNSVTPQVSQVISGNVTGLASSHIHDPVQLSLVTPAEVPDRTFDSVPDHGLSNLVSSNFSGLELGTVVSLDDITIIPFQTSTPKNRVQSPKSLIPEEIHSSSKSVPNNDPPCTKQLRQIQVTDGPISLETGREQVTHSILEEQPRTDDHNTKLLTLSQAPTPTPKDNFPLSTITNSVNKVFEQHLFIPQPLEKSKKNISKDRIPSAISGKKWREYHLLKEKIKQEKIEAKEKAKVARKRKQEEAKRRKETKKAKINKKETPLKTKNLASNQNVKQHCGQCANILNSDTEDDEDKNVGCDFCTKWFHLKCTDFIGLTYEDVKNKPFKCNTCIIDNV